MTLKTVTISITAATSSGTIPADAVVTFELDGADVDTITGEIVVPDRTSVTLVNGVGSISKWPNARGTGATQYRVTIEGTNYRIAKSITVPDANCDLYSLLQFATIAPDAASAAELAAQGYAAAASVDADEAASSASAASTSASNASTSASAAAASASAASQSATDAQAAAAVQNAAMVAAVTTGTPTSSSTVLGETAGVVRRFTVSDIFPIVSVKRYGATGDGVTNDSSAIQEAIDSFASGEGTVYFPAGSYAVPDGFTVAQNGIKLLGAGQKSATLAFSPSGAATCLEISKGAAVSYSCSVSGFSFAGGGAHKKIAIKASDFSGLSLSDIEIRNWTGGGSVGLQTLGREVSAFSNLTISADVPIQISNNPNYTIDCNEFTFRDLYLIANDVTKPCILVDDGVYFSGLTFEGFQSWVGGKYGFYYNNTTSLAASEKLSFSNIWREQTADATGYVFYIANSGGGNITGLTFSDCHGDTACNGYYLRGILYVQWNNCLYTNAAGEALNVDATVINMTMNNFHAQGGSTATLTGQTLRGSFLKSDSSSPFPDVAWYQSSGASARAQMGPLEVTTTGVGLKINCAAASNAAEITDGTTNFAVVLNSYASLYTVSNHALRLGTNNAARWDIQTDGHLSPSTDNTYTLGTASYRVKNAYFSSGVGFHGATPPTSRPSVTGSRGANAALASLLTALAACGIVSDDTTA